MHLEVGQQATSKRVFRQIDFDRFAQLSGDDNPIHVDPEFAAGSHFGQTVCHGMLLYGTICAAINSFLAGFGVLQLEQEMMFAAPTFVDEEVTIQLLVKSIENDGAIATLSTDILKPDGSFACQGQAIITTDPAHLSGETTHSSSVQSEAKTLKGLRLGQQAETARTFTFEELAEYADLSGDGNPVHLDCSYARSIGLPGPIIPGALLGGLFSYLLGTSLPGRGTNWLKQQLTYWQPAYLGEAIRAQVEIVRLRPEKELVNLSMTCTRADGTTVCTGQALVLVRDLEMEI